MTAKYKALDIASLFVQLANSIPDEDIDNLKLNKLCYYAQGWSLARFGTPLFDEAIQAWDYGPLIPSVYYAYKPCGRSPIKAPATNFDEGRLSNDELSLITDVYYNYGKYTSTGLMNMTHAEGTPWRKVYIQHANNVISTESMKNYFSNSNEMQEMLLNISSDTVVNGLSSVYEDIDHV